MNKTLNTSKNTQHNSLLSFFIFNYENKKGKNANYTNYKK